MAVDPIVEFNKQRWEALSAARVRYSVPRLDLNEETAKAMIDKEGQLGKVKDHDVLCLAAGGGQQSAAFALLGARVTVFDLSENQLAKDRETARHYGYSVSTIQGDMQDLSVFRVPQFDIVWLAHSINFVPDARAVITQIARIVKSNGRVRINFTNPYVHGVWDVKVQDGYLINRPYVDGGCIEYANPIWTFRDPEGRDRSVEGPREFRHSLSTIMNSLIGSGFRIDGFWEEIGKEEDPKTGSWEHFKKVAPPWLTIWGTRLRQVEQPPHNRSLELSP
jgi:SAM-dependent methyltransferase